MIHTHARYRYTHTIRYRYTNLPHSCLYLPTPPIRRTPHRSLNIIGLTWLLCIGSQLFAPSPPQLHCSVSHRCLIPPWYIHRRTNKKAMPPPPQPSGSYGKHRLSTAPPSIAVSASSNKHRQLSHLNSQLTQLQAHLSDLEDLVRMTAVQAEHIRALGGIHGALYVSLLLLSPNARGPAPLCFLLL